MVRSAIDAYDAIFNMYGFIWMRGAVSMHIGT